MKLAKFTESDKAKRLFKVLISKGRLFGLFLYLAGIAVYCLFPAEGYHRKKFFDENALLPGLSKREFKESHLLNKLQLDYRKHHKSLNCSSEEQLLIWIYNELTGYGLEVYTQNYTLSHVTWSHGQIPGTNIYGILRAGRSPSVEAIVLTAPNVLARRLYIDQGEESVGVTITLALAKYFTSKNYWAKDIIFLIPSGGVQGVQAWINAYTGTHSAAIQSAPLVGRSGALQAVINIELGRGNIRYINIIPEGVNAILPNLDLVFVASTLCESEGLSITYHVDWNAPGFFLIRSAYYKSILTSVAVLFHHASGLPYTNHAPFLTHRIDSLTLRGIHGNQGDASVQQLTSFAKAVEGMFRSINNLLERLHHSEFFYINMSRNTFVSIGQYSSFFVLLLAPLMMESCRQWVLFKQDGSSSNASDQEESFYDKMGIPPQLSVSLNPLSFIMVSSLTGGCGLYFCPSLLKYLGLPLHSVVLFGSLLMIWLCFTIISTVYRPAMTARSYNLSSSLILLLITIMLYSLALMHFAFSFLLSIMIAIPLSLSTANKIWSCAVLLVFSPPLLLVYYCLGYTFLFSNVHTHNLLSSTVQLLLTGVEESYFFHHLSKAWLYPLLCLMLCSVWFLCWNISITRIVDDKDNVPAHRSQSQEHHPHSD